MSSFPTPTMPTLEELAERIERLLLRHQELQRTQGLLEQQVGLLTHERDLLKSKLSAARQRIDTLIERLPADPPEATTADATPSPSSDNATHA